MMLLQPLKAGDTIAVPGAAQEVQGFLHRSPRQRTRPKGLPSDGAYSLLRATTRRLAERAAKKAARKERNAHRKDRSVAKAV